MKFNYRNFLKTDTFKHPLKILDGGLKVKAEGSASVRDDADGSLINFEITEQKDDLVNLVYADSHTFAELSNKVGSPNYTPAKIAKIKGQSIGNDIGNVIYKASNHNGPFVKVDLNRGTKATTERFLRVDLTPAYKLIGETGPNTPIDIRLFRVRTYDYKSEFSVMFQHSYTVDFNATPLVENTNADTLSVAFRELAQNRYDATGAVKVTISGSSIPNLNGTYTVNRAGNGMLNSAGELVNFSMLFLEASSTFPPKPLTAQTYQFAETDPVVKLSGIQYRNPLSRWVNPDLYSLFGLWGEPKKFFDSNHTDGGGFITKKTFKRKLREVASLVNPHGIDVIAVPYLEKLIELDGKQTTNVGPWYKEIIQYNDDGTTETKYYEDINESCMRREYNTGVSFMDVAEVIALGFVGFLFNDDWRDANFGDAIRGARKFLERKYAQSNPAITPETSNLFNNDLAPLLYDDLSPYDSSARDVLNAMYGPRDVLLADLKELVQELNSYQKDNIAGVDAADFIPGNFASNLSKLGTNQFDDGLAGLQDQINNLRAAGIAAGILTGGLATAAAFILASYLEDSVDKLRKWRRKAGLFEHYTGESIIGNGYSINELASVTNTTPELKDLGMYKHLTRMLIPVDMGTVRAKRKKKNFFGKVVWEKYKKDLGIRWVEVYFVNAFVHELHRSAENITGVQINNDPEINPLNWDISSFTTTASFAKLIEGSLLGSVTSESIVDTTLKLSTKQSVVNAGTQIYFEVYDSTSLNQSITTKHPYSGMWTGIVLDEYNILFKVPAPQSIAADLRPDISNLTIRRIIKPYPESQPAHDPVSCQIEYNVPYLPGDDAIRNYAFNQFGNFDQSKYAIRWNDFKKLNEVGINHANRDMSTEDLVAKLTALEQTNPNLGGFEVFKQGSDLISSMRGGIDIFTKAEFLLTVLRDAFGPTRVSLIETVRSHADQEVLQLGGASSNFLSWHNYGIAVKINITDADGISLIRDGSPDFFKLMSIAESFSEAALNGSFGAPCNVVWCARLKTGPNIFVWEFLPVGIGHKDAVKFRDAAYNQLDPFEAAFPVDVDSLGYAIDVAPSQGIAVPSTEPDLDAGITDLIGNLIGRSLVTDDLQLKIDERDYLIRNASYFSEKDRIKEKRTIYRSLALAAKAKQPYILKSSNAYKNAMVVGGKHFVSPQNIMNYPLHRRLILKDVQEFLFLIRNKFNANGSTLVDGQRIIDWKNSNPTSFEQLIMYNALLGNFSTVTSLLSMDYVSSFDNLVGIANADPVTFVRKYLGLTEYVNVRIYPDGMQRDSGFITLNDGRMSVVVLQCRSIHPEGFSNMFGEKYADSSTIEFGQVRNGVFTPEFVKNPETGEVTKNPMDMIKSDVPVISGYAPDGSVISPPGFTQIDGTVIPAGDAFMVHVLIKDKIIDMLKTVQSAFENLNTAFLHDFFSNSPNTKKLIENEFGVIASQDLLTFDDLKNVYRKIDINKVGNDSIGDSRGAGRNSGANNSGNGGYNPELEFDPNRDQSVYESMVSTTQFTGIQFSRNTQEKPKIEPLKRASVETIMKRLNGDYAPDVRDIL